MGNVFPTNFTDKTTLVAGDKVFGYDSEGIANKNFLISAIFNYVTSTIDTDDVAEGTNLYYTNARVDTEFDIKLAAADTDDLSEGTTNKYASTTNVNDAGATMNTDTTMAGNGYFLDEDDMSSDDATKVASQQSIKAYVDTVALLKTSVVTGSRDVSSATASVTYSHGLGAVPKSIMITAYFDQSEPGGHAKSNGTWDGTDDKCVFWDSSSGAATANKIVYIDHAGGQSGVIGTVTTTEFDIDWLKISTETGTLYFVATLYA